MPKKQNGLNDPQKYNEKNPNSNECQSVNPRSRYDQGPPPY